MRGQQARGAIAASVIATAVVLQGCSLLPAGLGRPNSPADPVGLGSDAAATEGATGVAAPPPRPGARTVEDFDTTTAGERAAAAEPPASGARLGTTVASLGDPTAPGFWAETPLVTQTLPGRLEDPATGNSVQVELRPSGGAPGSGTRVSLPALRVLEAPLTALPELVVYGL